MSHAPVLPRPADLPRLLPGLALSSGIALLALGLRHLVGWGALSPLILALVMGIALRSVIGPRPALLPGTGFAVRPVLRGAIVLLGFQMTLGQLVAVGPRGAVVILACLLGTFTVTKLAARALGVEPKLAELIAAGTSVCGASAVLACNSVTRGGDEDVAYAIAVVAVFGTLSMLGFPLIAGAAGLSPQQFGLWSGASIHEVAQVVGTAFSQGPEAGQTATVAKLARVMMLAPLILALGQMRRGRGGAGRAPTPWFAFGFLGAVGLNSVLPLGEALRGDIAFVSSAMMSLAMAAMGLETDLRRLHARGLRPLALGAFGWLFISGLGLALVLLPGLSGT
ncbi:putative sulfate exporter family transporter [Pseudooceanicola sp. CBS1P-1]|uniref:Putative sulfate exporter family transporter n=1 Tax=Pseudooceanicola albus TaxID=2692189 RepID=A0A6L7G5D2_9RHOB|nr:MULTISPECIES: putative sulfate exporter family transporter [Pseudooceanicola]MBT9383043.1 putative sulfate exporter family transporter [Pseudooceanicola endophyticus]MXN19231.1 putative sulfate exporter family transporter [Pseudooceanicola albus]